MQITRNSLETAGPERLVHRHRLHRHRRDARRALARSAPRSCTSRPAPARPGTPTRSARRSTSPRASAAASARGGPIEVIRPGDRVFFEPGENHWHGAAPDRFMTHLAMQEADDSGSPVTWGEHVTDEQYSAARAA